MQQTYTPNYAGSGDGQAVYFLFGYRSDSEQDQRMKAQELPTIQDDIRKLQDNGYTVVFDDEASRFTLRSALYSKNPDLEGYETAAVCWSGHGAKDGSIQIHSGQWIDPHDIDPNRVSERLRFVVFSSCHTGKHRGIWQQQIGSDVLIIAWNRSLFLSEAIEFNQPDEESQWELDDLIRRLLINGEPASNIPRPDENWEDPNFDPGNMERYQNSEEDQYWDSLFAALGKAAKRHVSSYIQNKYGVDASPIVDLAGSAIGSLAKGLWSAFSSDDAPQPAPSAPAAPAASSLPSPPPEPAYATPPPVPSRPAPPPIPAQSPAAVAHFDPAVSAPYTPPSDGGDAAEQEMAYLNAMPGFEETTTNETETWSYDGASEAETWTDDTAEESVTYEDGPTEDGPALEEATTTDEASDEGLPDWLFNEEVDAELQEYFCPRCSEFILYQETPCSSCGRELDWSGGAPSTT